MFAFVGKVYPSDGYMPAIFNGDVWFVSDKNVKKIDYTNSGLGVVYDKNNSPNLSPKMIEHDGIVQFVYYYMWGNGQTHTSLYTVKDYDVKSTLFYGYLDYNKNGFIVSTSDYDILIDKNDLKNGVYHGTGRSDKYYWYYYDKETNSIKEYGGTKISVEQFKKFDGADKILSIVNGEIFNILYRANGIININVINDVGQEYEMTNILVGYDDTSVWTIDDFHSDADSEYRSPIYSGLYLSALNSDLATYTEFNFKGKNIEVVLNGTEISFDIAPYIENGITRVPMRAIFEALGAEVEYDAKTKNITARKGNTIIKLVAGSSTATINGKEITLTASVENKNGSTMVPLRFVSEALGAEVIWDGDNKIITINMKE
jgi:hypothetical protein